MDHFAFDNSIRRIISHFIIYRIFLRREAGAASDGSARVARRTAVAPIFWHHLSIPARRLNPRAPAVAAATIRTTMETTRCAQRRHRSAPADRSRTPA
ncbi:hypothetical protein KDW07_15355 [Burkholderia dolosa]|uniref:hypothetical protein n=1 Tax=Burkholderia dolosa TaxID=152500 RepID=UPI001BA204D4|nr:hypothetical protein [Burkholderia dolosa]MBR8458522.1 hypothetical protein [Burkholderia dolosa]MDN7423118.1 hypothetical protein [Burkholderia dolosa]